MQGVSAAVAASGIESTFGRAQKAMSANDTVSIGVIGPGSRGQELIRELLRNPGVRIAAVCDVYEPRFAEVDALVGSSVPRHHDYRELLDRKDLDSVVVATPLYLHAQHVIAGLESGRAVYGEKSMELYGRKGLRIHSTHGDERWGRYSRSVTNTVMRRGSRMPCSA